ncbi:ATP-binding protein [Nocardia zapadnayensis]|uniref:ATP-binding protein n=1 Tax=Nocardia rhamnosiphila TaxID=426716 RepID=UPI0022476915|nr:ATP-binding protein [Nocardia zapadnayensis]MCX0271728.1 ATP-binding protein [Nocardia zapadnayensis]
MGVMTPNPVRDARGRECLVVEVDLDMVAAARVRAEVRRLVGRCAGIEVGDAVQVSDELVSNAARHAGSPRTCRLLVDEHDRFRIEVHDSSPVPARIRRPDHTGGRGLLLVTQLATRWGTDWCDGGKTVWAELGGPAGS